MGTIFQFSCPNCGYKAEVSGGKDFGFTAATNTILCKNCKKLYDVVTSKESWKACEDDWLPPAYQCPKSKRHEVELWFHPGACPKCSLTLVREDEILLWD
jgi:hypothetical protein